MKQLEGNRKRQQIYRDKKKRIYDDMVREDSDVAFKTKLQSKKGRPAIVDEQPELLSTILKIATFGAAADDKRCCEALRTVKTLSELTDALHREGFNIGKSTVYYHLLPKNQKTIDGKKHIQTVPVRLIKAEKSLHQQHQDAKFCSSTINNLYELASFLGNNEVSLISQDDKAKVPIGIAAAHHQAPLLMNLEYRVKLPDHDWIVAEKHKLTPWSYSHAKDFNRIYELEDFEEFLYTKNSLPKPVLILLVDGGPDENPRYQKTIEIAIHHFIERSLDALFIATNAPHRSAFNPVERRMAPLSRHLTELEYKNFKFAGETLADVFSSVVIDGYSTVAEFIDQKDSEIHPDEIIKKSQHWIANHPHYQIIKIDTIFEPFTINDLEKLNQTNATIIAFQSTIDGKFCVFWKFNYQYFVLNVTDNIEKDNLDNLLHFTINFLIKSLDEDHSGVANIDNNQTLFLSSLRDKNGLNLFFIAAQNGNTIIVKIFLQIAFNVNYRQDGKIAADLAYENQHFDTLLELLKSNSCFPKNFNAEDCTEELKKFSQISQKLHEDIENNNNSDIERILNENSHLRYFYNHENISASATAIKFKNFEAYEMFVVKNLLFAHNENFEKLVEDLSKSECKQIREIHFKHKKNVQEQHLIKLIEKSSLCHSVSDPQEKFSLITNAYKILNKIKEIKILLKIAATLSNLHLIFDFNHDSVHYLDPTADSKTLGLFYLNGRIYIGAKQFLDPKTEHQTFATIAHELCHFVIYNVFNNIAKPYRKDDKETENEFEQISSECKSKKDIENIISLVYDCYTEDIIHAELIVRVPHILAHYFDKPHMVEKLRNDYQPLFDFYDSKIMPQLETALITFRKHAEDELKSKDRKLSLLIKISIILAVLIPVCGIVVYLLVYEPTYKWSELNIGEKNKVFDSKVKFKGEILNFSDVFGKNDSSNNVFNILNSQQINKLIHGKTLELDDLENEVLKSYIYLVYSNSTHKLRNKIENAIVDFQGKNIIISSIIGNETRSYEYLNSKEIYEMLTNQSSLKIGIENRNETKFFVPRKFIHDGIEKDDYEIMIKQAITLTSDDLISESVQNKSILLSDDAGSGKTTIFGNLALEIKERFPLYWVQLIDLKSYVNIFKRAQKDKDNNEENKSEQNIESLINFLSKVFKIKNSLEKNILFKRFKEQRCIFLWDGFDEIAPTYTDFVLEFLIKIKKLGNIQFVSTRRNYETVIAQKLQTSVFHLLPYFKAENQLFLSKFYHFENLTKTEISKAFNATETFIIKMQKDSNDEAKDYITNPLLLEIIAEISIDDDEFKPNSTTFYSIYETFIKRKIRIANKKGEVVDEEQEQTVFDPNFNSFKIYQYFAIKLLQSDKFQDFFIEENFLSTQSLQLIKKYDNNPHLIKTNILSRQGILEVDSENNLQFVHRTFAEFFVAQYFVHNYYEFLDFLPEEEAEMRIKFMCHILLLPFQLRIQQFTSDYLKNSNFVLDNSTIFEKLFRDNTKKLSIIFYRAFSYNGRTQLQTVQNFFRFNKRLLEDKLLKYRQHGTIVSYTADENPVNFIQNFESTKTFFKNTFKDQPKKIEKLIYGENQKGNFILGAFKAKKAFAAYDVDKFLKTLDIKIDFDLQKFENLTTFFDFYRKTLKTFLTKEEKQELFCNSFLIVYDVEWGTIKMNELGEVLSQDQIQEIICRVNDDTIFYYIKDFNDFKKVLQFKKNCPEDEIFDSFYIFYDFNYLALDLDLVKNEDFFEVLWNFLSNYTSIGEKEKLLISEMYHDINSLRQRIPLYKAALLYGNSKVFEFLLNVVNQYSNKKTKIDLCNEFFTNNMWEQFESVSEVEFVKFINESFSQEEIRELFKDYMTAIFFKYENEKVNSSIYSLLESIMSSEQLINLSTLHEFCLKNPDDNVCTKYNQTFINAFGTDQKKCQNLTQNEIESYTCELKNSQLKQQIGENVKSGEFPHLAALGWSTKNEKYEFKCTGSLISKQFVLTSAQCRKIDDISPEIVKLGELESESKLDEFQMIEIDKFILFMNGSKQKNDIALVKIRKTVTFTKNIKPAQLWSTYNINSNEIIATYFIGKKVKKTDLNIYGKASCNLLTYDSNTQICAGNLTNYKGTCQRDIGAPLQITLESNRTIYYIIGIASYGLSACDFNSAIYTRVSAYSSWIFKSIED
ncbi:hypothetical protein PVAND_002304 [Polypedilum vanderplanki]|uniref:Peptidase S1 domain-containing protein n=1 Tax=Polypedilum vanderplanki TaxID=319348 RepID=A0A9J6BQT9_POLVA|nr:hypothetical protein PVAND_002304 [Polypedilum vanderplanki]